VISWNHLGANIVCAKSVESFKSALQHHHMCSLVSLQVKARFGIFDVTDTDIFIFRDANVTVCTIHVPVLQKRFDGFNHHLNVK